MTTITYYKNTYEVDPEASHSEQVEQVVRQMARPDAKPGDPGYVMGGMPTSVHREMAERVLLVGTR